MRERPTGDDLLIMARQVLREELLELLPEERRYDALMVANAMAIAARQIKFGDKPERQEWKALADLLGETVKESDATAVSDTLGDLYHKLGDKIRIGELDPGMPSHDNLYAFLLEVTMQKLRESAPKFL
mgnify:FL=1